MRVLCEWFRMETHAGLRYRDDESLSSMSYRECFDSLLQRNMNSPCSSFVSFVA
jgi:hypothetical protein